MRDNKRILVADDDETSLRMVTFLLEKFGYEVLTATNGNEALAEMRGPDAPPIAILDWVMPELNGVDVIRLIRGQTGFRPYLLLLTVKDETQDKVEGLEAGADDYLIKPIDPAELRARVNVGERILDMQRRMDHQVHDLKNALDEIKALKGILPICSYCKKIRDDEGYWEQVEVYMRDRVGVDFSHSICPECMDKYFPELRNP